MSAIVILSSADERTVIVRIAEERILDELAVLARLVRRGTTIAVYDATSTRLGRWRCR